MGPSYSMPNRSLPLAEIAKRYPDGVISLLSALSFYGVTDQLPTQIWLAIENKAWKPKSGFQKYATCGFENLIIRGL